MTSAAQVGSSSHASTAAVALALDARRHERRNTSATRAGRYRAALSYGHDGDVGDYRREAHGHLRPALVGEHAEHEVHGPAVRDRRQLVCQGRDARRIVRAIQDKARPLAQDHLEPARPDRTADPDLGPSSWISSSQPPSSSAASCHRRVVDLEAAGEPRPQPSDRPPHLDSRSPAARTSAWKSRPSRRSGHRRSAATPSEHIERLADYTTDHRRHARLEDACLLRRDRGESSSRGTARGRIRWSSRRQRVAPRRWWRRVGRLARPRSRWRRHAHARNEGTP